jgi:ATP-dependent helicase/nuclease subunit B
MANIITFAGETHFVTALAQYLLSTYHCPNQPESFARVRLLLPNHRGANELKHALFQVNGNAPLLLPSMYFLGELCLHEWVSVEGRVPQKVISHQQRMGWMVNCVYDLMQRGMMGVGINTPSIKSAIHYAESFLSVRDDCLRANVCPSKLAYLVPTDYAEHWSETLSVFQALTAALEEQLEFHQLIEPITHQRNVVQTILHEWHHSPPSYPVIAAGSTASTPITAQLLHGIAALTHGTIVLPSVDMQMQEKTWQTISVSHPQYHLKQWLDASGLTRQNVTCISLGDATREHFIIEMMRPAENNAIGSESTEKKLLSSDAQSCLPITLHECADDIAEVETIMLMVREALHQGVKQIVVVAEDDCFSQRLSHALDAYHIPVNRASGIHATHHPAYRMMMLVAELLFLPYSSAQLLAVLRLPDVGKDDFASWLDMKLLRGWHSIDEMARILPYCQSAEEKRWLEQLSTYVMQGKRRVSLLHAAHIAALKHIAPDIMADSTHCLFQLMQEGTAFFEHVSPETIIHSSDYVGLLGQYFSSTRLPISSLDSDAPVTIMGALETRLHSADYIIIPKLNEGTWPHVIPCEPWLNRAMRSQLGLNFAERQVSLAAHDFCQLLKAPQVLLTRARKECDSPTNASRFFERVRLWIKVTPPPYLYAWRSTMVASHSRPRVQAPAPNPPLESRMTRLSATQMETLQRNPFEVYASHICRFRELEPLDAPFSPKELGNVIHKVMERAAPYYDGEMLEPYLGALQQGFMQEASRHVPEKQAHFYLKKLERMMDAVVETEQSRAYLIDGLEAETPLSAPFNTAQGTITFTAKIDRIERRKARGVCIIDYKTGEAPKPKEVASGERCQLIIAAMVLHALSDSPTVDLPHMIQGLEYWQIGGGIMPKAMVTNVGGNEKHPLNWEMLSQHLLSTAAYFCFDANATFPWLDMKTRFTNAAAHFARVGEW